MLQIVNDICDFVPSGMNPGTHTKDANDALSDLKNRNITLPAMIHLIRCPEGKTAKFLKSRKRNMSSEEEMAITVEMLQSGAIDDAKAIAAEIKRQSLKTINPNSREYSMIKDMVSIAQGSKYYSLFTKIYKSLK
jgi:geranylgeranyl pyrophosphate synthase